MMMPMMMMLVPMMMMMMPMMMMMRMMLMMMAVVMVVVMNKASHSALTVRCEIIHDWYRYTHFTQ